MKNVVAFSVFFIAAQFPYTLLSAQALSSKEYQVRAVFLFNFTSFIEWPVSAFPDPTTPFVIGILGDDPFGNFLDETVGGESLDGHALTIKRFRKVSDISPCTMLYVNTANKSELRQALEKVKRTPVLTVGDHTGFAEGGGMIGFVTERNKTRLHINLEIVREAGLNISSKLLGLAEIVESKAN